MASCYVSWYATVSARWPGGVAEVVGYGPSFTLSFPLSSLPPQLKTKFDIWNISVKYIDDAGDCVSMDSQGMLDSEAANVWNIEQ